VVEALRSIGLKNLSVAHGLSFSLRTLPSEFLFIHFWKPASQDFYSATTSIDGKKTERLDETVQPEVKRKIIGDTFIRVSENVLSFLNPTNFCY
jgi:GMP synthase PP-ATPase subunit